MMQRRSFTAEGLALATVLVLFILIYIGSRGLQDFDSALIGYAIGTVFAAAGMVYRYTLWLGRAPTNRYFRAGWKNFLSWKNFRRYTFLVPKAWWTDIFAQTFIARRGFVRWVMHMSIFWGVILSLMITIPLTFGWFRFTLAGEDDYRIWFFGISTITFPLDTVLAWTIFHALDFTSVLLLIGVGLAFWRRTTDAGLLATQRFGFDLMPLILLFSIAITGLALSGSSIFWEGRYYWFISLTHQVVVVVWLISLPFAKFFHIVERPATIGITLYQTVNQDLERGGREAVGTPCARCGEPLPSAQFVSDLKATLRDLGQAYELDGHGDLHDYCPTCKRVVRGDAYYQLLGKKFV